MRRVDQQELSGQAPLEPGKNTVSSRVFFEERMLLSSKRHKGLSVYRANT